MSFPFEKFIAISNEQNKSQEFIDACTVYAKKLSERNLPVLFSLEHLAIEIGIQSDYIRILNGDEKGDNYYGYEYKYNRYNYFKLKKRNGSFREIMAPAKDLKYIQKWILQNILVKFPLKDSCKGFRKEISIYHNAKVHEKADIILKVDLLKFYDTITEKRVYGIFKAMGYVENLAYTLAKITTAKHRISYWNDFDEKSKVILNELVDQKPSILPQGAPTSPMLANIAATRMDHRFETLSKIMNFNYSRYADDLTFSINADGKLPTLKFITKIITEENFFINSDKVSYMKKGCKQYVTGLTTTNGVNVSKKYRKMISEHIFYCRKYGVESHLEKRFVDFPHYNSMKFYSWLYGHLCFMKSINEKASKKMLEDFNKINWSV
jgi:RNA-directed DNA polymerase